MEHPFIIKNILDCCGTRLQKKGDKKNAQSLITLTVYLKKPLTFLGTSQDLEGSLIRFEKSSLTLYAKNKITGNLGCTNKHNNKLTQTLSALILF